MKIPRNSQSALSTLATNIIQKSDEAQKFEDFVDYNHLNPSIGEGAGLNSANGYNIDGKTWCVKRGDALQTLSTLEENSFHCAVTSPPYYWQRNYDVEGQLGLEASINEYVNNIADVMDGVKRVLRKDGALFLNLGDTYYSAKGQPTRRDNKNKARRLGLRAVDASGLGVPRKTAIGLPWRVALEMIKRGWILRSPIIWQRSACLPEPTAHDRPWRTYEMLFLFAKTPKYYFDRTGLTEANEEDVWHISGRPKSSKGLHSAAFPDELVRRCLRVGCPVDGQVLDPFAGTGTVLRVGLEMGHCVTGIDLSSKFCNYMVSEMTRLTGSSQLRLP